MPSERDYLIITNNPLVRRIMTGRYEISYMPDAGYRDVLVRVRDLVHLGHRLYTHPLSGSVKPNETPYKSVVVSISRGELEAGHAELMGRAIAAFDKFAPRRRELTPRLHEDFQLIDYTLLAGAIGFDAAAGLSNTTHKNS